MSLTYPKRCFKHVFPLKSLRNALYSRFSTNDWEQSNRANFNLSDKERSLAERLRADAYQAIKATDTQTRNRQASNSKRLGSYWICTSI